MLQPWEAAFTSVWRKQKAMAGRERHTHTVEWSAVEVGGAIPYQKNPFDRVKTAWERWATRRADFELSYCYLLL